MKNNVSRREFLKLGAGVAGNAALGKQDVSKGVSVIDFGADRTGHKDSAVSVSAAISHLVTSGAQTLLFPLGVYRLSPPGPAAMSLSNRAGVEIDGQGSTLLMGKDALCLSLEGCANMKVRDLTIDWDPLPYTQGTVSDSGIGWFDLHTDDGFPGVPGNGILAIESYDRSLQNIVKDGIHINGDKILAVQPVGPSRFRIRSPRILPIASGTVLVIRFKGNHDAIRIAQCHDVSFTGVTLLASHSMGYNISLSNNLSFGQCTIGFPKAGQRLLSTNADGMHVTNCSGSLIIDQCTYQGMGDDALNVNAPMWHWRQGASGAAAALVNRLGVPPAQNELPGSQDQLEILDSADLHRMGRLTPPELKATAASGLVSDPARVPVTTISRCHFAGNHARAIVAHAHLQVKNCSFRNTSLAAIMIAPDDYWMEGPATSDIVIDGNSFSQCHYASHDPEGTVTVDIEQTYGRRGHVAKGIAQNVQITSNIFNDCYTAAISCRSVDGLVIRGNQVGRTWVGGSSQAAIAGSELKNGNISDNTSTSANTIVVRDSESMRVADNHGFS